MYDQLIIHIKLDSYSNAKRFFILLLHVHFCFWGPEHLSYRSISKRCPKSDAAPRVEKSSTSRAFHTHDTEFYWLSENALHKHFIAERCCGVWMELLQLTASVEKKKHLSFEYEFSLNLFSVMQTFVNFWGFEPCVF